MREVKPETVRRLVAASRLMQQFARDTGLEGDAPARRCLWTDAFAVCNALSLHRASGDAYWLDLALRLVDQVHQVLGRFRQGDPRKGWISGLGDAEGELRPTAGGLRIGKPFPERPVNAPSDPAFEWEQDGQYYHYLTQWMYALSRVSAATGDARYHEWAVELARVAHRSFAVADARGGKRLLWKMSIDLTRPLVDSSGHHDPLDGLATYATLVAQADTLPPEGEGERADLHQETRELAETCAGHGWATADPLGIGGLLISAYRVAQVEVVGRVRVPGLLENALEDAARSLSAFRRSKALEVPLRYRLPFREIGLSIGLAAAERLKELPLASEVQHVVEGILGYADLRVRIERTWLAPASRRTDSWGDHRDINAVMLATSLLPDAYLS
jgi:hypothetical protein